MRSADLVVIGAGVVGLAVARAAHRAEPSLRIEVVDKEPGVGKHASGRNSGVLHSGVYYKPDSWKARFCRTGNEAWRAWCAERGVPVRSCGKVIVARTVQECAGLTTLAGRASRSGVRAEWVSEDELKEIEPRARTIEQALFTPDTGSVDPRIVVRELAGELAECGVRLSLGAPYYGRSGDTLDIGGERVVAGHVVNAAGLYADRVARDWAAGEPFRLLPFKGLYLRGDAATRPFRTHIYPVPDLSMPFLGVHVTVTVSGGVKLGPTAMPALWREQYASLGGFKLSEALEVTTGHLRLLAGDAGARRLGLAEVRRVMRRHMVAEAATLVDGLDEERWRRWGRPGIRAQLVDRRTGKLHLDFAVERAERSTHILNAISPAFTCALPFGEFVVEEYLRGTAL